MVEWLQLGRLGIAWRHTYLSAARRVLGTQSPGYLHAGTKPWTLAQMVGRLALGRLGVSRRRLCFTAPCSCLGSQSPGCFRARSKPRTMAQMVGRGPVEG